MCFSYSYISLYMYCRVQELVAKYDTAADNVSTKRRKLDTASITTTTPTSPPTTTSTTTTSNEHIQNIQHYRQGQRVIIEELAQELQEILESVGSEEEGEEGEEEEGCGDEGSED